MKKSNYLKVPYLSHTLGENTYLALASGIAISAPEKVVWKLTALCLLVLETRILDSHLTFNCWSCIPTLGSNMIDTALHKAPTGGGASRCRGCYGMEGCATGKRCKPSS